VLKAYADVRPPVEERVEEMFAVFQAIYVNTHSKEGAPEAVPSKFLRHAGDWPAPEPDYASQNRKAIAAFRNVSSRIRRP
jgi:protein-tyrosine-phosphatase